MHAVEFNILQEYKNKSGEKNHMQAIALKL